VPSTSPSSALRSTLLQAASAVLTPGVDKAIALAEHAYAGEIHWSGLPLIEHVEDVLRALLPFEPDEEAITACLLHHVLETGTITVMDLEEEFGSTVRSLIAGVQLLSQVQVQGSRQSIDSLRLMLLSVSDDIRVPLIILCDRVSLLLSLDKMSEEDRKWCCENILYLFAPVAARLGIHALKQRMENGAFPVMYPTDAARIAEQMQDLHARTGDFLPDTARYFQSALDIHDIEANVQVREKLSYSIFSKMRAKSCSHVEQLHDLFALRILVETEADCYRVLGVLHQLGRPVANRFKDYIAFRKPNGYRSLHTTMMRLPGLPEGVYLEVQVRTHQMHREAEYGIAAHWKYKERGSKERMLDRAQLQEALTRQFDLTREGEYSVLTDHIFVLTPTGEIVELSEGATPLDFAFQIHTDLGLSFKAARVNGDIVPLHYQLENGDIVEIIKHKQPQPSPAWLTFVRMASSRAKLRRHLSLLHREEHIAHGRAILNDFLRKHRLPPIDTDLTILRHVDGLTLTVAECEDMLMRIGQGYDKLPALLQHIDALKDIPVAAPKQKRPAIKGVRKAIEIEGGLPMPLRYAKCCKPDEGTHDAIIGIISRGSVMVHRKKCRLLKAANVERRVGVKWTTGE